MLGFRSSFVFKLLACLALIGAVFYGDTFWFLLVFVFAVFAVGVRRRPMYVTEERSESQTVDPAGGVTENVVVSRLSRRRR